MPINELKWQCLINKDIILQKLQNQIGFNIQSKSCEEDKVMDIYEIVGY